MSNDLPESRCTDCGDFLDPIDAEAPTFDGKPRCEPCFVTNEQARLAARPPSRVRRWLSVTCKACGHDFTTDSTSLAPEGCSECGGISVMPQYRTPGLIRAAAALAESAPHLTSADATLSAMRRERAGGR